MNRALVIAELKRQAEQADDQDPQASNEPTFDADQVEFDEKGEKGQTGEIEMAQLNDEQLAEMWMRRLQTTPADFLRRRFAAEAAELNPEAGP